MATCLHYRSWEALHWLILNLIGFVHVPQNSVLAGFRYQAIQLNRWLFEGLILRLIFEVFDDSSYPTVILRLGLFSLLLNDRDIIDQRLGFMLGAPFSLKLTLNLKQPSWPWLNRINKSTIILHQPIKLNHKGVLASILVNSSV